MEQSDLVGGVHDLGAQVGNLPVQVGGALIRGRTNFVA